MTNREWIFDFHGTPVTYGVRGDWRYVVDLAASKVKKRKELRRGCLCIEGDKCEHEEPIRQYAEKYLHDTMSYPWCRIVSEAPIKIGSSEKLADVVGLENENLPVRSTNYEIIGETKKGTSFVVGNENPLLKEAESQLLSYMVNSNARQGFLMNSDRIPIFYGKKNGEIVKEYLSRLVRLRSVVSPQHKERTVAVWNAVLKSLDSSLARKEIDLETYTVATFWIRGNIKLAKEKS
jgi:hypothetical protein